uniref:Uncharacterized protein n=1 Tax=Anopheles melas TaxID=34690 RepID=A0A182UE31_9DIPT
MSSGETQLAQSNSIQQSLVTGGGCFTDQNLTEPAPAANAIKRNECDGTWARGGGLAVVLDGSVSRSIGVRGVDGRGSVASVHSRGSVAGVHSWGSVRDDGLGDDSRGGVDGRGSVASVDGRGGVRSIDGRGGVRGVDGRGGVGNDGRGGMGHNGLGVDRRGRLADDGVESVHIIGGVVDGAHGTVRLDEGVLALHDITVAALDLRLDISGQTIVNTIVDEF